MALFWLALTGGEVGAAPIVDQTNFVPRLGADANVATGAEFAQTFTVGSAGMLSRLDLQLWAGSGSPGDVTVQVRSAPGGVPEASDAAPLFSATFHDSYLRRIGTPSSFSIPYLSLDVRSENIAVNPGDMLAISVRRDGTTSPGVFWRSGDDDGALFEGYSGGRAYSRATPGAAWTANNLADMGFQVWVDPGASGTPPSPRLHDYMLFETAQLGEQRRSAGGTVIDDAFFAGVNFLVSRPTKIRTVGGALDTGFSGPQRNYFGAIVKMDSSGDAPDAPDLSSPDVLGTTLVPELIAPFDAAPVDTSGPLSLELQPGWHGLLFGGGKFGADADNGATKQHPPNGPWTHYVIRQSDGLKITQTEGNRYFATAEFAPGTVQVRPTMDAQAQLVDGEFIVLDGPGQISMQQIDAIDLDRRGIFEFDLRAVPAGAVVTEATLEFQVSFASTSTMPQLQLYGYAGDGYAGVADATKTANFVGTGPPVDRLGLFSAAIDPAYVQSLLGSADFFGLLALGDPGGTGVGMFSNEAGISREPPLLTIAFTLPGDYDGSGSVDAADYGLWRATYGSTINLAADGNGNGVVDAADYVVWRKSFPGSATGSVSSSSTVPEPGGIVVFAGLILGGSVTRLRFRTTAGRHARSRSGRRTLCTPARRGA